MDATYVTSIDIFMEYIFGQCLKLVSFLLLLLVDGQFFSLPKSLHLR